MNNYAKAHVAGGPLAVLHDAETPQVTCRSPVCNAFKVAVLKFVAVWCSGAA